MGKIFKEAFIQATSFNLTFSLAGATFVSHLDCDTMKLIAVWHTIMTGIFKNSFQPEHPKNLLFSFFRIFTANPIDYFKPDLYYSKP